MQCTTPKLVPLLLDVDGTPAISLWSSISGEMKKRNISANRLDGRLVVLAYDEQSRVPPGYNNQILSRSLFMWMGNVVLVLTENMNGEKKQWPRSMYDLVWLMEIQDILERLNDDEI